MLFLNMALLLGLATVAVPIVIHLLNRRSARELDWGAMRFLLDSLVSRRRRILLEEILLLATRCLLLVCLVLAVARPFVPSGSGVPWLIVLPAMLLAVGAFGSSFALWRYPRWRLAMTIGASAMLLLAVLAVALERRLNLRRFGAGASRDVALVLDGSSSMTLTVDGKSNFDRAVDEARKYVRSSARGASFSLIVAGQAPLVRLPAPIADRKEVLAALDEVAPVQGSLRALDALAAAAATLAQGYNPAKQIVLLTDGQATGWDAAAPARWQYLADAFRSLPSPPQVICRRFPLPPQFRNASVAGISFSRPVVGTDRKVAISVRIENAGAEAVTPSELRLDVEGQTLFDRSVGQILPGAAETVQFFHQFRASGAHEVTAVLAADDDLPADNTNTVVLCVTRGLRVLVADGNPAGRFLDRGAAFAALALAPAESTAAPAASAIRDGGLLVAPEVVEAPALAARRGFSEYDAVFLADVPLLPSESARALSAYVEAGGGLLVAPGENARPSFYNDWSGPGGRPLMPASMERRVTAAPDRRAALSLTTFTHPALRLVAEAKHSDMASVSLDAYWELAERPMDEAVSVGGRLAGGTPWLVERKAGSGTVLQCAGSLDTRGGNLGTRQSFLPLVHELLYYLARPAAPQLNLPPSPELTLQLPRDRDAAIVGGRPGLAARYAPKVTGLRYGVPRLDANVDFDWGTNAPVRGVPPGVFHAQWTGTLVSRHSESYTLEARTGAGDSLSVWVDGSLALHSGQTLASVALTAGRPHGLRVQFDGGGGPASARLYWSSRSQPREVVPRDCLFAETADETNTPPAAAEARGPDGKRRDVLLTAGDEGTVARVSGGIAPGLYRMSLPEPFRRRVGPLADAAGILPFTVERDPAESHLTPLSAEDRQFFRKYLDFLEADSEAQVLQALEGKAFGQELWRPLALGALLLAVCEVLLARWIALRRRTGLDEKVSFEERAAPSASFREQLSRVTSWKPNSAERT